MQARLREGTGARVPALGEVLGPGHTEERRRADASLGVNLQKLLSTFAFVKQQFK